MLKGSGIIPCANLRQDISAPQLETNAGDYSYIWRSSTNIILTGSGHSRFYKAPGTCYGCPAWIECDIYLPSSCGGQLLAKSIRKNLNWGSSNDAKLKQIVSPSTNNNGNILNSYNIICGYGTYNISTTLTNIPLPSYTNVQWSSSGPITLIPGPQGCSIITNGSGFATISCTVLNGEGCTSGLSESYLLDIRYPCSASYTNSSEKLVSRSNESSDIMFYPNPAEKYTILNLPISIDLEKGEIFVFNTNGHIVFQKKTISYKENLDLSNFKKRDYTL